MNAWRWRCVNTWNARVLLVNHPCHSGEGGDGTYGHGGLSNETKGGSTKGGWWIETRFFFILLFLSSHAELPIPASMGTSMRCPLVDEKMVEGKKRTEKYIWTRSTNLGCHFWGCGRGTQMNFTLMSHRVHMVWLRCHFDFTPISMRFFPFELDCASIGIYKGCH